MAWLTKRRKESWFMKITFRKDTALNNDEIEIHANARTKEIDHLLSQLEKEIKHRKISAKIDDEIHLLNISDIYTFRIEDRILYAYTNHNRYTVQKKLYEIKEQTDDSFIQVSKSEIINSDYIHHLELEKNGIIKIYFNNDDFTHSSRRYLKHIKESLNL